MIGLGLRKAMRGVDAALRWRQGIVAFADDPECLIRISRATADRSVALANGVAIPAGAPVLHVHLWNDRMPIIPKDGPTTSWANLLKRRLRFSLARLATCVEQDPNYRDIVAITALPVFPDRLGPLPMTRVCEHLGWEVVAPRPTGWLGSIHARLDGLLIWGLIWAFNPAGLRGHGMSYRRIEVWMSRARLLERHGLRQGADGMKVTSVEQS